MRESRTYGSGRGACDETHVPTATIGAVALMSRARLAASALSERDFSGAYGDGLKAIMQSIIAATFPMHGGFHAHASNHGRRVCRSFPDRRQCQGPVYWWLLVRELRRRPRWRHELWFPLVRSMPGRTLGQRWHVLAQSMVQRRQGFAQAPARLADLG